MASSTTTLHEAHEQMAQMRKEMRAIEHEKIRGREKRYYAAHREECNRRSQNYYESHKDALKERAKVKVECPLCHKMTSKYNLKLHQAKSHCLKARAGDSSTEPSATST